MCRRDRSLRVIAGRPSSGPPRYEVAAVAVPRATDSLQSVPVVPSERVTDSLAANGRNSSTLIPSRSQPAGVAARRDVQILVGDPAEVPDREMAAPRDVLGQHADRPIVQSEHAGHQHQSISAQVGAGSDEIHRMAGLPQRPVTAAK